MYKSLSIGTYGRSLADQFSEEQTCSGQGFDLIVGAIRHHFGSYLEARTPKGIFVEFTSRINNRIRVVESGFNGYLPSTMEGFIMKRQAKLTPDQAKHLPTCQRGDSRRIEWWML